MCLQQYTSLLVPSAHDFDPTLVQCCTTVCDAGPTLSQCRVKVPAGYLGIVNAYYRFTFYVQGFYT